MHGTRQLRGAIPCPGHQLRRGYAARSLIVPVDWEHVRRDTLHAVGTAAGIVVSVITESKAVKL